ncbi:TPA: restriction endonuclease subunit S, partial [Haemophilus influenzae]
LHYYLHALDITKVLYKFGSGLRQNLSFLDFKRLPIIDISLAEQQQIADYLDKQTSKIDQAIALKTAHIEKLKEYKSVLINDVVTGKVRV